MHGDLVGQRAQLLRAEQAERAEQLERAIDELRSPEPLVWIAVPGRSGEWPLPKEIADYLTANKRGSSR